MNATRCTLNVYPFLRSLAFEQLGFDRDGFTVGCEQRMEVNIDVGCYLLES